MKKQKLYNRLQKQYEKLNQSIQKAMQTGRFYAYTQFKQEQLLSRLKRCSFQLKQLGAGVAVVAALGVATPAVGQTFISRTGVDNPCDAFVQRAPAFVDIDGDGDLDCFVGEYNDATYSYEIFYYENVGSTNTPTYTLRNGAANPLNGVSDERYLTFVDIDGDGDMDAFASADFYYNYNTGSSNDNTLSYYENTGTATNPVLTIQLPADNPLNIVVTTFGMGNLASTAFVDIDGDGDMDCFVGFHDKGGVAQTNMLYCENTGTVTMPTFVLQSGAANPLIQIDTAIIQHTDFLQASFADLDNDGDMDAIINGNFLTATNIKSQYYENVGTATVPTFLRTNAVTFFSPFPTWVASQRHTAVDLDQDTDIDLVSTSTPDTYTFWENQDTVVVSIINIRNKNLESIIYPNPTPGSLSFEQSISGKAKLYNISGQLVLDVELEDEQSLNIEFLNNGIYFLEIQTAEGRIREKVILQK